MIADSEQALQTLYLGKSMNGVPYETSKQEVGYSLFSPMFSPPNFSKFHTRRTGYFNHQSLYIFGISLDDHLTFQTAVHTQIEKSSLLFHQKKIGGSSYNVYKRHFDSMVAPTLDLYGVPVWLRFCSNKGS